MSQLKWGKQMESYILSKLAVGPKDILVKPSPTIKQIDIELASNRNFKVQLK